jgi:Ca-activated chloride channel family protein
MWYIEHGRSVRFPPVVTGKSSDCRGSFEIPRGEGCGLASKRKRGGFYLAPGFRAGVRVCAIAAALGFLVWLCGPALSASAQEAQKSQPSPAAATAPAPAQKQESATSDPPAAAPSKDADKSLPPAEINIRQPNIHTRPIMVNVDMVVIGVTVTDPYDRIVTGLDKDNFEVFDEKVAQKILSFSTEDSPISVGMIFDSSGSMADKIEKSKEAALQFFKTSNPEDEFMLIDFNERPDLISAFTSKFSKLQDSLLFVKSGGKTALLDAIYLGLEQMKKAHSSRKALLVISDGGDNHSRYTENEVKRAVRESDVQIYSVAVLEPLASRNRTPEEAAGPGLLSDLSEVSGGRMFSVEDPSELPDIAEKISIELRNEYVIGYKPSNMVRDGRWRRIRVKLDPPRGLPPLQVYNRTGYYAPTQ